MKLFILSFTVLVFFSANAQNVIYSDSLVIGTKTIDISGFIKQDSVSSDTTKTQNKLASDSSASIHQQHGDSAIILIPENTIHMDTSDGKFDSATVKDSVNRIKVYHAYDIPPDSQIKATVQLSLIQSEKCINLKNLISVSLPDSVDSLMVQERYYMHYCQDNPKENLGEVVDSLSAELTESKQVWVTEGGYYWFSFFDTTNKILYKSEPLLVEKCSLFELPNSFDFTSNDFLVPKSNYNIVKIDLYVFSSLGEEVFSTNNPEIRWNGINKNTGLKCVSGNYFYNCDVFEMKNGTLRKRNITGVMELYF